MSLKDKLIKLASENPKLRKHLVPLIKEAMEFDTPEAYKEYMHDHPNADPHNHSVKKQEEKKLKEKKKPLTKAEHTHTLPGGNKVRVYDIGPDKEMDRYTVIMDGKDWDASANPGRKMSLNLSEGGRGFSQWGEAVEGKHLGKPIKFEDLDEDTKKHITYRVEKEGND